MKYLIKSEVIEGQIYVCQGSYETDSLEDGKTTYIEWSDKLSELESLYLFEDYEKPGERLLGTIMGGAKLSGRDKVIRGGLLKGKTLRASEDISAEAYREMQNVDEMCYAILNDGFKYDKNKIRYIPLSSTLIKARSINKMGD